MEQRLLGSSGVYVSVIGLGTWPMGGTWWGKPDDDESVRTIHRALELDVTLYDTSPLYGLGHAEDVLARAIAGRRQDIVISDKVPYTELQPEQVRANFEASCQRLNTDYLDIYFVHWPHVDVPIGSTMEALERLRREGRIRAIGVSNFCLEEMIEAQEYGRVDVLQPPCNMFWRYIEQLEIPYCLEHNIGIMTYSSLAQGLLTGTLSKETRFAQDDSRTTTVLFQPEHYGRCIDAVEQLRPIAHQYGKSIAQLAINWVTNRPGVTTALVGARTVADIEENAGGAGWATSEKDTERAGSVTRTVLGNLPEYPDMFRRYARLEMEQRRHRKWGRKTEYLPS